MKQVLKNIWKKIFKFLVVNIILIMLGFISESIGMYKISSFIVFCVIGYWIISLLKVVDKTILGKIITVLYVVCIIISYFTENDIFLFSSSGCIIIWCIIKTLIRFANKIVKYEMKKEQLSDTDFEKNKNYYRDILNSESPLVLGYLDDFEINIGKVVAEILYLEHKKIISMNDGKIEKNNYNAWILSSVENYILDNIIDGKIYIKNFNDLKKCVTEYASNIEGLVVQSRTVKLEWKKIWVAMGVLRIICSFW